ncbi:MAG: hypothetical protein ACTSUS_04875 [Candidatus Freyarchaeota archaeon]
MNSRRTTVKIAGVATLTPLSVILQCLPPLFLTPWFMRIDLVALPWILCWMLFGFKAALLSLLISIPLVGFLGPFAGGWVGAVMKSVASVWMFAIPALFAIRLGMDRLLTEKRLFALSSIAAIAVRDVVCIIFNLYFAIPFFFGMTPEEVIAFFSNPRFQSFIGLSLGLVGFGAYFAEIAFWNTIQGIIDSFISLTVALIILRRFSWRDEATR